MIAKKYNKTLALPLLGTCLILAACGTTTTTSPRNEDDRISAALERAAQGAKQSGNQAQNLGYLEQLYKRNSTDPAIALRYAEALRKNRHYNRALMVLAPYAKSSDLSDDAATELAALHLAIGQYQEAEKFGKKAIGLNTENHQAYHFLGIALDAQEKHEDAETAFRKGLEFWQGDPTTIMNNLALNLTAQGYVEEAIEILYRAKALAPERVEIERNLRIAIALMQSEGGRVPKPSTKPDPPEKENKPLPEPVSSAPVEDIDTEKDIPSKEEEEAN